ncbi:hypothetical protein AXF42_Ash021510 [Apostasia shenzhenica]|uniref:Uncharacterized protein n=1 Tax=Apostasia shenzhenica TaxID=1088818 RepID=A0A2H9ZSF3_9ASPA|nr:hypothetical protein AXF42_Ash021510 [Apostasia shenzhenica]
MSQLFKNASRFASKFSCYYYNKNIQENQRAVSYEASIEHHKACAEHHNPAALTPTSSPESAPFTLFIHFSFSSAWTGKKEARKEGYPRTGHGSDSTDVHSPGLGICSSSILPESRRCLALATIGKKGWIEDSGLPTHMAPETLRCFVALKS